MADAKVLDAHHIEIGFSGATAPTPQAFRLTSKEDLDIPISIRSIEGVTGKADRLILTTEAGLDRSSHYQLFHKPSGMEWGLAPSLLTTVLSVLLVSALVQNFVFTRYLGLCVFFGVSRKRETAGGMGGTFTFVGFLSGFLSWLLHRYVLSPLKLDFLQIIVFIGVVAFLVQMTDTIMKKVQRGLHRKFGIYVVLITTNCIILAVPLLNALNATGFWESMALALGSGLGFGLALFLMSCAREKTDLSPIPPVFQGLPIAFILAGLFALAFLGFSGLKVG